MNYLLTALMILGVAHLHAGGVEGFVFSDPAVAASVAQEDHGRLVIYFCGHCPSARKFLATDVKALADAIQEHHAPLKVICVTPELKAKEAAAYGEGIGFVGAAFGHDGPNKKNISLSNIYQLEYLPGKGGKSMRLGIKDVSKLKDTVSSGDDHGQFGSYRIAPPEFADPKVKELWWAIENGIVEAFVALGKFKKKARAGKKNGDDILALAEAVASSLQAELTTAMAGGDDFITFEALENVLMVGDGLIETDEAEDRLKALKRDKAIRDEIKAREAFKVCTKLMSTGRDKDRKQAMAGFKEIAKRFPDTVYGKKAEETK